MPSALHEAIVAIFRSRPKLATEFLVTALGVRLPSYQAVHVVESTLTNLKPVEYRADLVIDLTDGSGATVLAILVETQLDDDPRKAFTWPVYSPQKPPSPCTNPRKLCTPNPPLSLPQAHAPT